MDDIVEDMDEPIELVVIELADVIPVEVVCVAPVLADALPPDAVVAVLAVSSHAATLWSEDAQANKEKRRERFFTPPPYRASCAVQTPTGE